MKKSDNIVLSKSLISEVKKYDNLMLLKSPISLNRGNASSLIKSKPTIKPVTEIVTSPVSWKNGLQVLH